MLKNNFIKLIVINLFLGSFLLVLPVQAEGDICCKIYNAFNNVSTFSNEKTLDACKMRSGEVVDNKNCGNKIINDSLPKLTAPDLRVSIPGLDKLESITCGDSYCSIPWLAQYIAGLQKYAIGIIGILAAVTIMIGGITWLTATGNQTQITSAKKWISGGLGGLVLVLCSYMLLYTINPNLTVLNSLDIDRIDKIDLPEIIDPVIVEKSKTSGQKIPLGKYCGCLNWRDTKSTTTLNSAEAINTALKGLHPSGPLNGLGNIILEASNTYGIDPAIYLANAKMDSDMGTSGRGKTNTNAGNITCPMTAACKQFVSGCNDGFLTFSSWENSIKGAFCYYKNSDNMKNAKTIRQMISTYAPPCIEKGECSNDTKAYIDYTVSIYGQYNKSAISNDSSEGKSCDCYNPCDRCAQAGLKCCEFKKK